MHKRMRTRVCALSELWEIMGAAMPEEAIVLICNLMNRIANLLCTADRVKSDSPFLSEYVATNSILLRIVICLNGKAACYLHTPPNYSRRSMVYDWFPTSRSEFSVLCSLQHC